MVFDLPENISNRSDVGQIHICRDHTVGDSNPSPFDRLVKFEIGKPGIFGHRGSELHLTHRRVGETAKQIISRDVGRHDHTSIRQAAEADFIATIQDLIKSRFISHIAAASTIEQVTPAELRISGMNQHIKSGVELFNDGLSLLAGRRFI